MKTILNSVWIIGILCIILSIVPARAASDAQACSPLWYCTAYSSGECGSRECIDINGCNSYEPLKNKECSNGVNDALPSGFFQTDKRVVKMVVEQDSVVQSIISINGSDDEKYVLEIQYPSTYAESTEFVTSSIAHKEMTSGDFGIVVDTRDIIPGTYVIPINISNEKYSRNITLIVDVVEKDTSPIIIDLDSYIKLPGAKNILNVDIEAKDKIDNITYDILDDKGSVVYSKEEEKGYKSSKSGESIALPEAISEGIYTLAVKIYSADKISVESKSFAVFSQGKYFRTEENHVAPEGNATGWIITGVILLAVCAALILKKYDYNAKKVNVFGRNKMFRINMPKFGLWGKKDIKVDTKEDKLETLKKSYERGFISEKEYGEAVRNYKQNPANAIGNSIIRPKENIEQKAAEIKMSIKTEKPEAKIEDKEEEKSYPPKASEEKVSISVGIIKKVETPVSQMQKMEQIEQKHEQSNVTASNELPDQVSEEIPYIKEKKIFGFYKVTVNEESKEPIKAPAEEIHTASEPQTVMTPKISKESILDRRDEERAFGLSNGYRLYSLRELLNILPNMPEYMWHHHTKEGRNDFSSWIIGVFGNNELAEEFRRADTQEDALKVLKKYE